ncbi:MAG: hypothetical protein R8L58_07880 [Mariprofundaceae bacterium]
MRNKGWMASAMGLLMMGAVAALPAQAAAADFEVQNVLEDTAYGAGIGALVGLGFMLISSKPTDHWNYPLVGAGVGIIAGAAYGTYTGSRAMASYEDGKLQIGMPSPKVMPHKVNGKLEVAYAADLFHSRF